MTKKMIMTAALLASFILGVPAAVQSDWSAVMSLTVGTKVRITTRSKQSFRGLVDRVTDDSIAVKLDTGDARSVDRADVRQIQRFEPGGSSRGAKIGIWAAIGLGVGAAIGAAVLGATGGSDETGKVLAPFLIGGAGAGAAVGAAMGKGEKKVLVYEVK